jgi:hypothetical protein
MTDTTKLPETCPACGAEQKGLYGQSRMYACGRMQDPDGTVNYWHGHENCLTRQLEQCTAERDGWERKARVLATPTICWLTCPFLVGGIGCTECSALFRAAILDADAADLEGLVSDVQD